MEQLDQEAAARAAEQQRQAAIAAALSGDQTPCDAAQAAYDEMRKVPQQQQKFNAQAEARANEQAKGFGIDPTDPEFGAKLSRAVEAEKAKFANTTDGQIPAHLSAVHGQAAGRERPQPGCGESRPHTEKQRCRGTDAPASDLGGQAQNP